jgi:mannose-6-phosphate isomerase
MLSGIHFGSLALYPLRFEPLFRRYLWGGRRLSEILAKPIGDQPAAESWEVVDHQDDQSVVRFGDLAGKSLRQLIADSGVELVGPHLMSQISSTDLPAHLQNRFPLLLKFLDANRHLSVQVHPDDQLGATLDPPDLGKTEAWYVMHADPAAKIYAGLNPGVTSKSFRAAVEKGETESMLHSFEPNQGDCVLIPAGTIHAIGAGLLIAEIQQASNTTFRVYDWGRVDQDGQSRPLHLEQAVQATDFERGPVDPVPPTPTGDPNWMNLVRCDKFVMNRGTQATPFQVGGDGRFRILAVTAGSVEMSGDPSGLPLKLGETSLVPACLGPVELSPGPHGVELLEIFVPD